MLDNDLYKFTVMNAIQKKFPDAEVVYRFVDRGGAVFPPGFAAALREEVDAMAGLALTEEAERFMRAKCYYFDSVFFDLLKGYRFDPREVRIGQEGGRLDVEIRGLWYRAVLWEVPVMAMISELYFKMTGQRARPWEEKAAAKARAFAEMGAELSEFGTRRRFSFDVQDRVVAILKENMRGYLNGTSNVYLAMKYNLTPMGTHPHEWFMYHAAHYGYRSANAMGLANWVDVYDGDLGIALTDTYTTDNFFQSFDTKYAKLFDGLRWDSGDPFAFTVMQEHWSQGFCWISDTLWYVLDNALRYGGGVVVDVVDGDDMLSVIISDSGPGIAEAELKKVFEPFYRVERSRNRSTGGTGLGLSIARSMARMHGGDVTRENRPEGGLRATATFSRKQSVK